MEMVRARTPSVAGIGSDNGGHKMEMDRARTLYGQE